MLVFTNRAVVGDGNGIDDYQADLGFEESSEFRVLEVTRELDVKVLGTSSSGDSRVARDAISAFKGELGRNSLVVYVHGYDNTLRSSVERCFEIEKRYGVKTLCLTWPAKLGPLNQSRYRESQQNARGSKRALQVMLAVLARSLGAEPNRVTFAAHSQGCYLYQNLVAGTSGRLGHEGFFENILLLAPDCQLKNHRSWVMKLQPRNKIFITVNESDLVLRGARHVHGRDYKRLGLARGGFIKNVPKIEYVDFAVQSHLDIFTEHSYFVKSLGKYEKTEPFFKSAFEGRDAGKEVFDPENRIERSHLWYLSRINGYHFPPSLVKR